MIPEYYIELYMHPQLIGLFLALVIYIGLKSFTELVP